MTALTHHAYYIEGAQAQFDAYKAALKPFWARQYERFGIEDAREFIALVGLKNFTEAVYLVGAASTTSEAQQALLKLLEEPQAGTTIVLLVPHGTLLPTVKSRMLVYPTKGDALASPESVRRLKDAQDFLNSSGKERSDFIAKLLKDDEGVKERVREFVNGLEAELYGHMADVKVRQGLEDIAMVRGYLADRSPSLKMLLEHLAVALPHL